MENSKYLFCDLDGTLLERNENSVKISEQNLKMINNWLKNNNKLILVSGRHIADMKALIKQYQLEVFALSATNGAMTIDCDDNLIDLRPIDTNIALKLAEFALNNEYYIDFSNGKERFLKAFYKHADDGKSNNLAGVNKVEDFISAIKNNQVLEINFAPTFTSALSTSEKISISEEYINFLETNFANLITHFVSYNTPGYVSAVSKNVNKVDSVKQIIEKYKLDINNCYAIGDGQNDFEMLNYIPNSARMSGCHTSLQATDLKAYDSVADFISEVI